MAQAFVDTLPKGIKRTIITVNGCPGTGKSAIYKFAKKVEKMMGEEGLVILNGKNLPSTAPENNNVCTGDHDYLRKIYDPEIKHLNFNKAMLVGFGLIEKEKHVYKTMLDRVVEDGRSKVNHVVFIWERDSVTAGNIFIRANQFNCLLDSASRSHVQDSNRDWENVKVFAETVRDRAVELHRPVAHKTFLITMLGNPMLCLEKIRSRGRAWECDYITLDYLRELDLLHKEFAGYEDYFLTNRGFTKFYRDMYKDVTDLKHVAVNTDRFFDVDRIDEMKDAIAEHILDLYLSFDFLSFV